MITYTQRPSSLMQLLEGLFIFEVLKVEHLHKANITNQPRVYCPHIYVPK